MSRRWLVGLCFVGLAGLVVFRVAQASPIQQALPTQTPVFVFTTPTGISARPTLVQPTLAQPTLAITAEPIETELPIETIEPIATDLPEFEARPTLFGIMILITPTPEYRRPVPPSLQIPELVSRLRGQTGLKVLGNLNPLPSYQSSPVPVEIDEKIDLFFGWLIQQQREYRDMTGRYCQLLSSHSAIPANGEHLYPDLWYAHPTDQQYSWEDLNVIQYEPLPFEITIDVYSGPEGPGFVSCFEIDLGGIWRRCKNYGPEAARNTFWAPVEVE